MFPRRIILYLFLAYSLDTTNAHAQLPSPDQSDTIIVHFDVDRFHLSSEADSIIDRYFTANRSSFTFHDLKTSGYCDATGAVAYNDQLSLNRARTVSDYLRRHWLDSAMTTTLAGHGIH